MYAIGHFALGYLVGKGASKLFNVKINLPLLLVVSVLPDIDLILQNLDPSLFMHRGPTHSIITITALMIPFFLIYRKQAIPYYAVLLSHSILGDLFTGGAELFWPATQGWFSVVNLEVSSLASVSIELALFAITTILMYKTGDFQTLFKPNNHNWVLIIAFGAVFAPLLSTSGGFESSLPVMLLLPSLFWIAVFAYSILIQLQVEVGKYPLRGRKVEHAGKMR
ncbi:MAG: metal-dependent hydrolase [Candidatus Bathyarchaeota archaeon]|nr:metal-dependent hydrolase [Candidatus Bathyarchaeota archaeon]